MPFYRKKAFQIEVETIISFAAADNMKKTN